MPIQFWTAQDTSAHTHENIERTRLIQLLREEFEYGNSNTVIVAFDFSVGRQIDFAIFKHNAIIVVELKNYGYQPIVGSLNRPWHIKGRKQDIVKGGSS